MTKGKLTFRFGDREKVFEAGDAFYAPPGHIPVHIEPGSDYLQFSPADELRRTSEVIMGTCRPCGPADQSRPRWQSTTSSTCLY